MDIQEIAHESEHKFEVVVIATSPRKVTARPHERIGTLKRAAMHEFKIPQENADQYRLASTAGDPTSEFDDGKTVADYKLHEGSEIYLVKAHNDA